MPDASPPLLGYCTNVHAGADLATTRRNLERHAVAVRQRFSPDDAMGVGLWLSAAAAQELVGEELAAFREWLAESQLVPYTFNGFPYGDFHQPVVKHRVYEPAWDDPARRDYTLRLADVMDALSPAGAEGSISTLPIAWGRPALPDERLDRAADHLLEVAESLSRKEHETGRLIYLCLEPEPGCVLGESGDVAAFFKERLLRRGDESLVRRFLRICHDVCHAAVMFESQAEAFARYRAAGALVGKVQVSSAVRVPFQSMDDDSRRAALAQLADFAEDRYLHQTMVRPEADQVGAFYEDLPQLLAATRAGEQLPSDEWRIHFHVPVYLERFGALETTRSHILDCLAACREAPELQHFEVETYAWGVLPAELQRAELADGVADELAWLRDAFAEA